MLYALRFEGDSLRLQQIVEFLSTAGIKDRCGGCRCGGYNSLDTSVSGVQAEGALTTDFF